MNKSQKEYNRMVYRLTRPFTYVKRRILQLFEGRSYDFRGDSKTPFMRYEEQQFLDSEHLHYSNRHGLHLNPQKSVGGKTLKNKENVQFRVCMVSYKPPVYKGTKNAEK